MSRPILIAGGGTAGHILPALAIGEALVAGGRRREEIGYVGSRRGREARMVPEAGFAITLLPGRGVQRRLSLASLRAIMGLAAALVRSVVLVGRRRPAVVVSVGGYASLACVLAAVLWRVPLVVAEQNAVPGAANRIAARFARATAVAFEGTGLPRAVLTGNPVRAEIAALATGGAEARSEARRRVRAEMGVDPGDTLILAFGGSLGSRRINTAVQDLASTWAGRPGVVIHHVVGSRDWVESSGEPDGLPYRRVEYEERMPDRLVAADLVVSRAGATTVAELTALGLGAVLVPLPIATADHQTANAAALVDAGAARLVPDHELDAERLASEIDQAVSEPGGVAAMASAARRLGRPEAADRVAELVEEHRRG
jgi:undecaprenyldiphospho-muramoylpentapeptide beta-N-acetylglucosaminyltransferase